MAEKAKAQKTGIDGARLKARIAAVNASKAKAAELNGEAAQATKLATEELHFPKKAFTFLAQLARKEAAEAQDVFMAVVAGGLALGVADQVDMFDDRIAELRTFLAKVDDGKTGGPAKAPGTKTVASLVQ